jgi:methyl-accepting chemotaxis protein
MSQSISAATEEQTTNAKQVAKAIENVNELTQQAASAAEEMSAATEELSGLAQTMQRLVEQFRLNEEAGAAPAALPQPEAVERRSPGRPFRRVEPQVDEMQAAGAQAAGAAAAGVELKKQMQEGDCA